MDSLKEFLVELLTSEKALIDTLAIVFILTMIIAYPFVSKFYDKKNIAIRKNDFNKNFDSTHDVYDKLFRSTIVALCVSIFSFALVTSPVNSLYLETKTSIKSEKIYEQGKDYAFHVKDNIVFFLNDKVIVRKIEDHSKFDHRLKNMSGAVLSFDRKFMNDYDQNGLSEEIEYQADISRLNSDYDDYDGYSIKIVDKRKSSNVVNSNRLIVKEIEYVRTLFGKEIETKSELQIKQIIE